MGHEGQIASQGGPVAVFRRKPIATYDSPGGFWPPVSPLDPGMSSHTCSKTGILATMSNYV